MRAGVSKFEPGRFQASRKSEGTCTFIGVGIEWFESFKAYCNIRLEAFEAASERDGLGAVEVVERMALRLQIRTRVEKRAKCNVMTWSLLGMVGNRNSARNTRGREWTRGCVMSSEDLGMRRCALCSCTSEMTRSAS